MPIHVTYVVYMCMWYRNMSGRWNLIICGTEYYRKNKWKHFFYGKDKWHKSKIWQCWGWEKETWLFQGTDHLIRDMVSNFLLKKFRQQT